VNFRLVFKQLGLVLVVLSACMLLSDLAVWVMPVRQTPGSETEGEARLALFAAAALGVVIGGLMWLVTRKTRTHLGRREALLLVALSWLIGAALAGAPFMLWAHLIGETLPGHPFRHFINCYFEAMSGLTTTGATVLKDIEAVAPSLLFWRALTHWLGGLGIVLLFVAVLPSLGVGGKRLFRVEAPGPEPEGVRPHIRDTARTLWYIYLGLTIIQILALILIGRMDVYHACCHTFATLATGGFSTRNASVGAHESLSVDVIIIIFMVFAGANFGLYYQLIRRKWKTFFGDTELRVYLIVMGAGAVLVIASIWASMDPITLTTGEQVDSNLANSVRQGLFTTVAIKTTTGFCTADFNQWPFLAKAVLVMLMFIGGSAGSTAGGIKAIRVWIAFRVMLSELEKAFRPNVVRPVRIVLGAGLVMLLEQAYGDGTCDFTSAATASVATLCTIGPGLGKIGAIENYGWFSDASKIVLSLLMALGRLEIFAILVLFMPRFWRGD
jgi:trk system potassium uptake protein TrkH